MSYAFFRSVSPPWCDAQSAGHNELDNVESLLQKRTDRLFEAGRAMEQLDKYIFSCLMNKQLHIKLRGPRKFKCMRKVSRRLLSYSALLW
jgi:hypothetical protein